MRHTRHKHSVLRRGFTLTEVLVAVSVIALGALPLMAVVGVAIRTESEGYRQADATLAASVAERTLRMYAPAVVELQAEQVPDAELFSFDEDPANPISGLMLNQLIDGQGGYDEPELGSAFKFIHQGFLSLNHAGNLEAAQRPMNLPIDGTFGHTPPGAPSTGTVSGQPYLHLSLAEYGFDYRVAARVSRWDFRRTEFHTPDEPDFIATPAEYEYAVFVVDTQVEMPSDVNLSDVATVVTDVTFDSASAGSGRALLGPGITLPNGTLRDSLVLVVENTPAEGCPERFDTAAQLGGIDEPNLAVDRKLQQDGFSPAMAVLRVLSRGALSELPEGFNYEPCAGYSIYVLPAFTRAIVTGRVKA